MLLAIVGSAACPVLDNLERLRPAASRGRALSTSDIALSRMPRPAVSSHVHGETPAAAYAKMNRVLQEQPVRTASCESFEHASLNNVTRVLHSLRSPDLQDFFASKGDRRKLHFDSLDYKEALWKAEEAAATLMPSHAPGGPVYNASREGKCAEAVMLWIHHLSEAQRTILAQLEAFTLPLMPHDVAPKEMRSTEYDQQIGCTSCHVAVHIPGTPPITPIPLKNSSAPQYPTTCPNDSRTGKPKVWYNRTKRCDWDYAPFCSPCEGVGGMIWGPNEEDWNPMPCTPLLEPKDIPAANLTSPLWPKSFSVDEYASLTFPGRDPCAVNFKNSTYTLHFKTDADGPTYHTVGHTGPSGPSPFPGKSWALANGNFYNTVDLFGHSTFCICLGPKDPVVDNAITGPLSYDFNKGAKLVGRERVKPEYFDHEIVADHWVKGPHHFWIDVATNQMVREWQPFNGLQTYVNWNLTTPDPSVIDLPSLCYKGLLHVNVSCIAPPPSA